MFNIRTMYIQFQITFLFITVVYGCAQAQNPLEDYIAEGLANNRVIKERNISLEQSELALRSAKSYYLPTLSLDASYTLADGGRIIELPLGDLLNGTYSALNGLTGTNQFPQLENQSVQFFPNNFYDAHARIAYPLVNADRRYGVQIRDRQMEISALEVEVYKAQLIRDIKEAYYSFAIAEAAVNIYQEALKLVERNLRNNQSLLENGSGLPAYVLRAESEVESVKSKIIEAQNKRKNAGYYLNFLVNRPLDTPIDYAQTDLAEAELIAFDGEPDVSQRAEIKQLAAAKEIVELQTKNAKSFLIPQLNTFVDLGSQAFEFDFNEQSRYFLFGLQLSVPLYSGNRNNLAIRASKLDFEKINLQQANTTQQLTLAASVAENNIRSAISALENTRKRQSAARSYFKLIENGLTAGTNSYIEYIDARNQLTNAELDVAITYFQLLINQANLERELAPSNR